MTCPITKFTYPSSSGQPLFYVYGNESLKRWVGSVDLKTWTALSVDNKTSVGEFVVDFSQTPSSDGKCQPASDPGSKSPPCVSQITSTNSKKYSQSDSEQMGSYSELFSCANGTNCPDASKFGAFCCGSEKAKGPCPGTLVTYGSNGQVILFDNSPTNVVVIGTNGQLSSGYHITDGKSKVSYPLLDKNGKDSGQKVIFDFTQNPGKAPTDLEISFPNVTTNLAPPKSSTSPTFPGAFSDSGVRKQWGAALCCKGTSWPPSSQFFSTPSQGVLVYPSGTFISLHTLLIVSGLSILGFVLWKNKQKKK